jgi:hypothetical protein
MVTGGSLGAWIATVYGLDGVRVPVGSRIFFFSTSSRPALGSTQPPIQWVLEALSPEVKRSGREADHSSPGSIEIKKMWSIYPLHIRLHDVRLN